MRIENDGKEPLIDFVCYTFGFDFVPFRSRPPEMTHSVNLMKKDKRQ